MDTVKEKIIFNVFEFLETKDVKYSHCAKTNLQTLAKKYHIKIKPEKTINIKDAFKAFILSENGYNETIPKLYNSL